MAGENVALENALTNFLKVNSESFRAASNQQRREFVRETTDAVLFAWEVENLTRLHKARLELQEKE